LTFIIFESFKLKINRNFFGYKNVLKHSGFRRYAANTSWLIAEKILRMISAIFIGVWIARYLGPDSFGLLSFAQSLVALFAVISTLGLDGIVVRELVVDEKKKR
jgi:O-antigen/teichoic acid export membrane protein